MLIGEIKEERRATHRNMKACDELLARLQLFHGNGIDELVEEESTVVEKAPSILRPWFSVVDDGPAPITVALILEAVSWHFKVSKADLMSARRSAEIVLPRQVAYYLSKKLTPRSLPDIGRRIGGRDHTSVLHGVKKIERLRSGDPELDSNIHAIATSIGCSLEDAA